MTIDEAIKHAREVAEEQRVKNRTCGNCKYCVKGQIHPRQGYCYFNVIHYEHDLTQKACSNWESNDDIGCECAEEHEQLAEWLEELKELKKKWLESDAYNEGLKDGKADAIYECINILNDSIPLVDNMDIIFGFKCAIERLEQLKE